MILKKAHIKEFRSITDSNEFEIGDITCLVGKNESGKTALLQALYRLNPYLNAQEAFDVTDDYPRRDVEDYRVAVENGQRDAAIVAETIFELDDADAEAVSRVFGESALRSRTLTLSKGYDNTRYFGITIDGSAALSYVVQQGKFPVDIKSQLANCKSIEEMLSVLGGVEQIASVVSFSAFLQGVKAEKSINEYIYKNILVPRIPKFLYFDEYYQMKGCANIEALKTRQAQGSLEYSDYPLIGLINLARLHLDELLNPTRTRELKNKLEGAGNYLTKKIIKYWSQNRYLQLQFDVRPARQEDPIGMHTGTNIWGDVYDTKHQVTTEMGTRSRGFIWFFSFLAWYFDIKRSKDPIILLLDETGLFLHAKAQADLLQYFEAEIKGTHQLIYTTHSPFMVDPTRFDRVRIVQDLSIETDEALPPEKEGTKVLVDVLEATGDSLFPLQGALGYEIYQTLFIGPNTLIVEGSSDLLYLQTMSAFLQKNGRTGLHPNWTITPVGGADKVPTFVALIGAQKLNVAVLIDYQKKDSQTIANLYKKKLLDKKKVITFAEFVTAEEADIEDLFDMDFYLKIVNAEFSMALSKPINKADLNNQIPRMLIRIEKYLESNPLKEGAVFNHYRPARYFMEHLSDLETDIPAGVLERFEQMFSHVNALL